MKKLTVVACVLAFALTSCTGDDGPTGPQGPPGPGTRVIYKGEGTLGHFPNPFCVLVKEIKLNDMPVVDVYIGDSENTWIEIPVYLDVPEYNVWAELKQGEVCLHNCVGWYYKIVVVY